MLYVPQVSNYAAMLIYVDNIKYILSKLGDTALGRSSTPRVKTAEKHFSVF
jgi:hypothetical protein